MIQNLVYVASHIILRYLNVFHVFQVFQYFYGWKTLEYLHQSAGSGKQKIFCLKATTHIASSFVFQQKFQQNFQFLKHKQTVF